MDDKINNSGQPGDERRREDIERLKKALREIADRLSDANSALKKAADKQRERKDRAAQAAEQLKKALEELRKRREHTMMEQGKAQTANPPQTGIDGKTSPPPRPVGQERPAACDDCPDCPLPEYKGDFTSRDEFNRLTNLPPITDEEIKNTNWDLIWRFMDF